MNSFLLVYYVHKNEEQKKEPLKKINGFVLDEMFLISSYLLCILFYQVFIYFLVLRICTNSVLCIKNEDCKKEPLFKK